MASYTRTEIGVGLFIVAGVLALAYLSISLGALELAPEPQILLKARFSNVGDLKDGAPVKLAGVKVGRVIGISLENYAAKVRLVVAATLELPVDTIASIRTTGLLGEAFVSLSPGASEKNLRDGDWITRTEPAINLLDLISKYAFGSPTEESEKPSRP